MKKYSIKVLPLKLKDALYNDLKYVAAAQNTTMAALIRDHIEEPITREAKKERAKQKKASKKKDLLDIILENQYDGPWYHQDKTDNELLYGEKLGED